MATLAAGVFESLAGFAKRDLGGGESFLQRFGLRLNALQVRLSLGGDRFLLGKLLRERLELAGKVGSLLGERSHSLFDLSAFALQCVTLAIDAGKIVAQPLRVVLRFNRGL